jgi:hypothetical protein
VDAVLAERLAVIADQGDDDAVAEVGRVEAVEQRGELGVGRRHRAVVEVGERAAEVGRAGAAPVGRVRAGEVDDQEEPVRRDLVEDAQRGGDDLGRPVAHPA